MRYQVPQFIDIEDKVVGQFTVKQLLYLAGGAGMCFLFFNFLPGIIAFLLSAIAGPISLALAFYRINNKPFIDFLESAFMYYTHSNLYIWKKETRKIVPKAKTELTPRQMNVPRLSESRLKDLSWSLDINENLNPLTGEDGKSTK